MVLNRRNPILTNGQIFKCLDQISRNHLNEGIENDYTWYNIHISRVVLDVFSLSTGMDLFQVTDF